VPRRKISVLILYNSPQPPARIASGDHGSRSANRELPTVNRQLFAESEAGVLGEVEAVIRSLDKLRIPRRAVGVREFEELPAVLSASDEPVIFNLVEGFWTDPDRAALVPTVVRSFGKACTGNDALGQLISLDKWQSKILLTAAGIPTPPGLLVPPGRPIPERKLFDGPYLVKPVRTDGSEGIDNTNLVPGRGRALRQVVRRIHDQLGQPALVEQYIEGRELNVTVIWRRGEVQVLSPAEIEFRDFEAGRPRIIGYEAKWLEDSFEYQHTPRVIPAPLPKRLTERVRELAGASCRALSCFDYCRVDFRLDRANRPYVLEVNANPDLSLDAGLAAAVELAGISYAGFVKLTIDNAVRRARESLKCKVSSVKTSNFKPQTSNLPTAIRWCRPEDRQTVLSFLAETGFFRPDEIDIARELIDSAIAEGPTGHYQSFVACVNQEPDCGLRIADCGLKKARDANPKSEIRNPKSLPVGWVCWGPTPCTLGTYDIYWIGVAPAWQGRGIGRALTDFAEQAIAEQGGRLFVVETSNRETYTPTRRFYEKRGYHEAGRLPDFYGPGDDKVILLKATPDATRVNK
jgi:D-alanine-D-alanine ligase